MFYLTKINIYGEYPQHMSKTESNTRIANCIFTNNFKYKKPICIPSTLPPPQKKKGFKKCFSSSPLLIL